MKVNGAHEYPKKDKNKTREKEGILGNTISFNIQFTLLWLQYTFNQ